MLLTVRTQAIRTTRKREPDSPTPETPTSQHQHLGFVYEHARTGRSICRKCNITIAVATPRAGFDVIMTRAAFGQRGRVWSAQHLGSRRAI